MQYLDWQFARLVEGGDRSAIVWRDCPYSYAWMHNRCRQWRGEITAAGLQPGNVVAVVGEYSPASITALLALMQHGCIVVPLARESREQHSQFCKIAEVEHVIELDAEDQPAFHRLEGQKGHPLLQQLRSTRKPGLIVFTSGSTGDPKAILHSLPRILEKFRTPRTAYRTINFLLFDHLGGFNTLCYTLANLGCTVVPADRTVPRVCEAIEKHGVELLPTSPSFLNLLLLSGAYKHYNLSSLKLITYGTEVMPEHTLRLANRAFPGVVFQQTYGLSELGVMRSKSAANDSLLVKVGGEDFQTKVVGGRLWIRAASSMLGYLNAPSPFDAEGWLDTGDAVIQQGEYYRILGRHSEIINVGGQKVYPAEVEKVIAEMPGVVDVAVYGEKHLLMGQIVVATVQLSDPVPDAEMRKRLADYCKGRLQPYMVPVKVNVTDESPVNYRFKKLRRPAAGGVAPQS